MVTIKFKNKVDFIRRAEIVSNNFFRKSLTNLIHDNIEENLIMSATSLSITIYDLRDNLIHTSIVLSPNNQFNEVSSGKAFNFIVIDGENDGEDLFSSKGFISDIETENLANGETIRMYRDTQSEPCKSLYKAFEFNPTLQKKIKDFCLKRYRDPYSFGKKEDNKRLIHSAISRKVLKDGENCFTKELSLKRTNLNSSYRIKILDVNQNNFTFLLASTGFYTTVDQELDMMQMPIGNRQGYQIPFGAMILSYNTNTEDFKIICNYNKGICTKMFERVEKHIKIQEKCDDSFWFGQFLETPCIEMKNHTDTKQKQTFINSVIIGGTLKNLRNDYHKTYLNSCPNYQKVFKGCKFVANLPLRIKDETRLEIPLVLSFDVFNYEKLNLIQFSFTENECKYNQEFNSFTAFKNYFVHNDNYEKLDYLFFYVQNLKEEKSKLTEDTKKSLIDISIGKNATKKNIFFFKSFFF